MRVVIQRVSKASVEAAGEVVGAIGAGLCLLVGIGHGDSEADVATMVEKVIGLRIFADEHGKMNLSLAESGGAVLVVSQFTLLANVMRGRRPSFSDAAGSEIAAPLIEYVVSSFEVSGVPTASGVFGARMHLSLVNDGPVTLVLEIRDGQLV